MSCRDDGGPCGCPKIKYAQTGPHIVDLTEGPKYICRCGQSNTFPICDGSHIAVNKTTGSEFAPLRVDNESLGQDNVYVCGCGHSRGRDPFCDGTHLKLTESKTSGEPLTPRSQARETKAFLKGVLPDLTDGITQMSLQRPHDPFAFLGRYILSKSPNPEVKKIAASMLGDMKVTPGPLKIIIAGPPCSGKGTQCDHIVANFGVVHISTGDILREAVRKKTPLGETADKYMKEGQLIPDDLIISIVQERLMQPDCQNKGWLLDGFPRSAGQAQAMADAGIQADCFFLLEVPDQVLIDRVIGRRLDPLTGKIYHLSLNPPPNDDLVLNRLEHRADDTKEAIRVRIDAFHKHISSIITAFTSITWKLNGDRTMDAIAADVNSILAQIVMAKQRASDP